jgi:hypothetical protein
MREVFRMQNGTKFITLSAATLDEPIPIRINVDHIDWFKLKRDSDLTEIQVAGHLITVTEKPGEIDQTILRS